MPIDVRSVTQDATALYGFVESVSAFAELRPSPVYNKASTDFFDYIRELGKETKAYLADFAGSLPSHDLLRLMYRQKLTSLRSGWSELHRFVQPAAEADTLNTPFSLLQSFYRKLHRIPGFENVAFAVFHLDEVNYWQIRASWFRELAAKLGSQIPNAPAFPSDLGLIGIPYSQSSTVFLNCLIPHEMGHFVYQRMNKSHSLIPRINQCIDSVFSHGLPLNSRRWCADKLSFWAEEIFCDLFALWIAGPAYAFAYIEVFDLARVPTGTYPAAPPREDLYFGQRHPADSCRLAQHVKFLTELGWWPHISNFTTHYIESLNYIATIPQADYKFQSDQPALEQGTVDAFFRLLPAVEDEVRSIVSVSDSGAADYGRHSESIESYLHCGVVPSTLLNFEVFRHPDPISVINTAYKIRLESLEVILLRIGHEPDSVRHRSEWSGRLEQCVTKAFEDY
jgi:hypothetical protein